MLSAVNGRFRSSCITHSFATFSSVVPALNSTPQQSLGSSRVSNSGPSATRAPRANRDSSRYECAFAGRTWPVRRYKSSVFCCRDAKGNANRHFTDNSGFDKKEHNHDMFEEQLVQLREEREELFGFTEEDMTSWSSSGGSGHIHTKSFMEAVEVARTQKLARERPHSVSEIDEKTCANPESEFGDSSTIENAEPTLDGGTMAYQASESTTSEHHADFSHLSPQGDSASMVDVGRKVATRRVARARSRVVFPSEIVAAFRRVEAASGDLIGPKGPIFATAKLAGIMGAKRTSDLIPLCHPLPLDYVNVDICLEGNVAVIECECRVTHKTGVEMEALTGASVAALTIYDMVKAMSHEVQIEATYLISKTGGKRDVVEIAR